MLGSVTPRSLVWIGRHLEGFSPDRDELGEGLRSRQCRQADVGLLSDRFECGIFGGLGDGLDITDDGTALPVEIGDHRIALVILIPLLAVDAGKMGFDLLSAQNTEDAEETLALAPARCRDFVKEGFDDGAGFPLFAEDGEDGVFKCFSHLEGVLAAECTEDFVDALDVGYSADRIQQLDPLIVVRGGFERVNHHRDGGSVVPLGECL